MKKIPKILQPQWLLAIAFFISGIFLGGLASYIFFSIGGGDSFKLHPTKNSFEFINPLLGTDTFTETRVAQDQSMKLEIESLVNRKMKSGDIETAGVYFRDLEPGTWVGIDHDATFSPGKLLKLPLMIAYFKLAEGNPAILDEEIVFHQNAKESPQELMSKNPLVDGEQYSIDDLIRAMIVDHSDAAANVLFDRIDRASLNEIFSDLGIPFKEDKETQDFLSVKTYSLFFRVLYNATYLNHQYSEKALSLLHEGDTLRGIVSGMPKHILTATRASGRTFMDSGKTKYEVYDCGIIYYPSHPYLLCATTRGGDINKLWEFLGDLGVVVNKNFSYEYAK